MGQRRPHHSGGDMRNRPGRRPHAAPCGALHRGLPAVLLIQFRSVSSARPTESAPPRPFPGRQRPSSPGSQTGGAFASCIVPCVCTFHKRRCAPQRPSVHRIPCVRVRPALIRARLCALRASPMRRVLRPDTGCHLHKSNAQRCFSIRTASTFRSAPPALFNPHRQHLSIRAATAAYRIGHGVLQQLTLLFVGTAVT